MNTIKISKENASDVEFQRLRQLESSDEIDLRELFSVIWKGKWLIFAITAAFAIASVTIALYLPNIYKSEALLAPTETDQQSGGLAALAGQFGGLASMAGINLGGGSTDKTQLAIEVMKSRQFVSEFIQKHKILPELMAADKWNLVTNTLSYDPKIYNEETKTWVREVQEPFKAKPSMQEAYKAFMQNFSINNSKETGMVTISIENISPYVAKQWVDWLIADINQFMKQRDVQEAIRGQTFLEEQLRKTNVADMRTVLYQLMEQAAKTMMFANVREEYVFKTIDPAVKPEEQVKPKRALICVLGTMLGGIFGITFVLFRYSIRKL